MTTLPATSAIEALVERCRKAWAEALSRSTGAACDVQVVRESNPLTEAMAVCVVLSAEGPLSGQAAIVIDQRNANFLAAKLGGKPGMQAVQELARQTIAVAIGDFQKQYGNTRAQLAVGAAPTWRPQTVLTLVAANGGPQPLRAHLLLSPQIESTVSPVAPETQVEMAPPNTIDRQDVAGRNMNLLMGVQLEVTLRFGRKRLPLKQLLELNTGTVVELDKRVHEPVELLLRDRVFAKGEVVIVDGHYGLRITEVAATPQQEIM